MLRPLSYMLRSFPDALQNLMRAEAFLVDAFGFHSHRQQVLTHVLLPDCR